MMDSYEINQRSLRLLQAQQAIQKTSRWRPRKAARMLCREFTELGSDERFWDSFAIVADGLPRNGDDPGPLSSISAMIGLEAEVLDRIGVDQCDIGYALSHVLDALDIAKARTQDISAPAIRNLRSRVSDAGNLICKYERGPLLQAAGYVFSMKGGRVLGGVALGGVNAGLAMNGDPLSAAASIKAALAVANGDLSDLEELLGSFFKG